MKTFSRLSLFTLVLLGFALMLSGNIADAQVKAGMGVRISPPELPLNGDSVEDVCVIFTLTYVEEGNTGPETKAVSDVEVVIEAIPFFLNVFETSGVLIKPDFDPDDPNSYECSDVRGDPVNTGDTLTTDKFGKVWLLVDFDCHRYKTARLDAENRGALESFVDKWETGRTHDLVCDKRYYISQFSVGQFIEASYAGEVPDTTHEISVYNAAQLYFCCPKDIVHTPKLLSEMEPCPHYLTNDVTGHFVDKKGGPIYHLDKDGKPIGDPISDSDGDNVPDNRADMIRIASAGVLVSNPANGVKVGDLVLQHIQIRGVKDLASWQMNVTYNPSILEVVDIMEGDFLEGGHTPNNEADDQDALFLSSVGTGWIGVMDWKEGNYLKRGDEDDLFKTKVAEGVVAASQTRLPDVNNNVAVLTGVDLDEDQNGTLMTICYRILEFAEEHPGLHNIQLSDSNQERISYSSFHVDVAVTTHMFPKEDVNRDGFVNILDLVMVASNIGLVPGNLNNPKADVNNDGTYDGGMYSEWATTTRVFPGGPTVGDSHSRVDVNNDGIVNVLDVVMVANSPDWASGNATITKERDPNTPNAEIAALAAAPSMLTPATIQAWIDLAQVEHDGSATFDVAIDNLQNLLVARIPSETKLLLNYPNPFNPETWIPYQLAESTEVTVMIHSMNGALVRTIELGHQAAGTYQSKSQAAYWDGRNEFGEQVASGVYFYTLTAGNFSATGKMLVRK